VGDEKNPSYVVGGTFDIAQPEAVGYRLSTCCFGGPERLMLVAEIRLFANAHTPTYHVVVGDVFGEENVGTTLGKLVEITVAPVASPAVSPIEQDHWMPQAWPLPFWLNHDPDRRADAAIG
jgi:hypothetical protein